MDEALGAAYAHAATDRETFSEAACTGDAQSGQPPWLATAALTVFLPGAVGVSASAQRPAHCLKKAFLRSAPTALSEPAAVPTEVLPSPPATANESQAKLPSPFASAPEAGSQPICRTAGPTQKPAEIIRANELLGAHNCGLLSVAGGARCGMAW